MYRGFLHWETDFCVVLVREFAPKVNMEFFLFKCFISLSYRCGSHVCTPMFDAPWQLFDGSWGCALDSTRTGAVLLPSWDACSLVVPACFVVHSSSVAVSFAAQTNKRKSNKTDIYSDNSKMEQKTDYQR